MAKKWKPDKQFDKYAKFIAKHPNYKGMPDLYWDKEGNRIQWEAPSNRGGGKFEHSHTKRLEWWRKKAKEIGLNPDTTNEWISKTAKALHPTKKKPCKVCGRVMDIRYAYPSHYLVKRLHKLEYIPEEYVFDDLEHITDLVSKLHTDFGDQVLKDLPKILKAKGITIPKLGQSLDRWLKWIEEEYLPLEPSILSPGAMSNAPDRLDGFHTFNKCCRPTADKGRHKENLRSYTTDRRVFEYWNEGNWVAANKLMGMVKTKFQSEGCANGHTSKSSADHIGPLSLGFAHRPKFQLLCSACNSGKNNRMMLSDVRNLLSAEENGEKVVSWYAQAIWDTRKHDVDSTELALRLSKLMRDNWHHAAYLLGVLAENEKFTFLTSLIQTDYADHTYSFANLRVANHITEFDSLIKKPRNTKYALEQKARAIRVALESLITYSEKENRNAYLIEKGKIDNLMKDVIKVLDASPKEISDIDQKYLSLLTDFKQHNIEESYRAMVQMNPDISTPTFIEAKSLLIDIMSFVAQNLSDNWETSRYVRNDSVPE